LTATAGVTAVSGLVQDQNLRALPNVLVRISGQQTRTGPDGRFFIANVPSGPHQLLELIGRDQIPLPGRWPNISYDFDVLPGVNNDLGRPLFLPKVNDGIAMPLDANNVVTQDTAFALPIVGGEPPVRITAKAGTHILFPPDVTDKRLSVTRIANNRVPMTLEDGRATSLYISVQPSGAVFETPLEISFPNLDRLPANSQVLLMSFDHDAGRYVQVGTGHVSAEGREVKSDPGSGIRVGAWHGVPPTPPQPEVTVLGHIQFAGYPAFEGRLVRVKEAWVEGQPAQRMTSGSSVPRWDYRATLSIPPNTVRLAKMEVSVVSSVLKSKPSPWFRQPNRRVLNLYRPRPASRTRSRRHRFAASPRLPRPCTFSWPRDKALIMARQENQLRNRETIIGTRFQARMRASPRSIFKQAQTPRHIWLRERLLASRPAKPLSLSPMKLSAGTAGSQVLLQPMFR